MTMTRHILSATDLSAHSLQAVDRAADLATTTGARHTVLHALGLDALGPLRNLLGERADSVAHTAMQQQQAALAAAMADPARHPGPAPTLRVEEGLASRVVPSLVRETDTDLVVVGARGQSLLRRLVVGSTASHLLRRSHCPVLVVKNPFQQPYRRVLLPMDFSPGSALALALARELAPRAGLVLLHAFDVPFEGMLQYAGVSQDIIHQYRIEARERALQQLREMAAEQGLAAGDYTPLVEHGDAVALITGHQQRLGCDLVVMGKHGTHVTEELLLGSVTKRVLSEGDADVLVVVDKRGPQDAG